MTSRERKTQLNSQFLNFRTLSKLWRARTRSEQMERISLKKPPRVRRQVTRGAFLRLFIAEGKEKRKMPVYYCELEVTIGLLTGTRTTRLKYGDRGCGPDCIRRGTCVVMAGPEEHEPEGAVGWNVDGAVGLDESNASSNNEWNISHASSHVLVLTAEEEMDELLNEAGFLDQVDGANDFSDDEEAPKDAKKFAQTGARPKEKAAKGFNNNDGEANPIVQVARASLQHGNGKEVLKHVIESGIKQECAYQIKQEMVEDGDEDVAPKLRLPMLEIPRYDMDEDLNIKQEPVEESSPRSRDIEEDGHPGGKLLAGNDSLETGHGMNIFSDRHGAIGLYPSWDMLSPSMYAQPDPDFRSIFDPDLGLKWTRDISGRICYNSHGNIQAAFVKLKPDAQLRVDMDGHLSVIQQNMMQVGRPIGSEAGNGLSEKELETFSHTVYTSMRWLLHPDQGGHLHLHCTVLRRLGTGRDQWGTLVLNPDCKTCNQISTPRRLIPYNSRLRFSDSEGSYYLEEASTSDESSVEFSLIDGTFVLNSSRDSYHTASGSLLGPNDSLQMPPVDLNDASQFTSEEARQIVAAAMAAPLPEGLADFKVPTANQAPQQVVPQAQQQELPQAQPQASTPMRRRQPMRRVRLERYFRERGLPVMKRRGSWPN